MIAQSSASEQWLLRSHESATELPRESQLAWRLAVLAAEAPFPSQEVIQMVTNRIVDNTGVALASFSRSAVAAARDQALAHVPSSSGQGASVMGVASNVLTSPEWAAWANGVAVRELDFHDTFLAADYSHPGDTIPALIAVAQHLGVAGRELARAIAVAYQVQISLVSGLCLHVHKVDHIAHLGPAIAAGLGALLRLDPAVTFHAIGQALHTTTATRQSRKGDISSWKAYAPAFAGKVAIEAVDRAMRGQTSPSPIWEGEDGVVAWFLGGSEAQYFIPLPANGSDCRGILDSYTKEHSAEYQAQALIDLARSMSRQYPVITDPTLVEQVTIRTSHHTHFVIGSGSGDPQKYSPDASRETLDHSLPYIFAVALQDGFWHHERSYDSARAHRPDTVDLWKKIRTLEDPYWTARYHSSDPSMKAFGGRVDILLKSGETLVDELAVADAHPQGARPFGALEYVQKFRSLSDHLISSAESERFLSAAQALEELGPDQIGELNVQVSADAAPLTVGIF